MTFVVVADDLVVGEVLVLTRQGIEIGPKFLEPALASRHLVLGRRHPLQALADGLLDGIGDRFAGPLRKLPDQVIRLLVLDQHSHRTARIYISDLPKYIRTGRACQRPSRSTALAPISRR